MRKFAELESELLPKLSELINYAYSENVEITIDAEEQDRLSISLHIIEKLAKEKLIKDWPGFGIALQAYGKRSFDVIDWLNNLINKRANMHLRLVKGAYWDYELKQAMDLGDVDKQVEVQAKLSRLAIEQERAASHRAQRERLAEEMRARI